MRTLTSIAAMAALALGLTSTGCSDQPTSTMSDGDMAPVSKTTEGRIWADGELFRTLGLPATFEAAHGFFDELYNTGGNGTFADGVAAISESKPGDQDYNGGRWHLNLLKSDVDPAKYASATSVDDLDLADFVSTDRYFECPLRPQRDSN